MSCHRIRSLVAMALAISCAGAWSDEATIRKAWAERTPHAPPIQEIRKTPIAGLYELRIGTEVVYSDESGNYMLFPSHDTADGHLMDMRARADLTSARVDEMTAQEIPGLPYKDAIVRKRGNGSRRMVVFEDPNCHFCKDVEKSFAQLKDVTIYTFLIPILGPDSVKKSHDIWCSPNNGAIWQSWMLDGTAPQRGMGQCDIAAIDRNIALAARFRVNGTPAILFDDGSRFAGAVDLDQLAARLNEASAHKG